MAEQSPEKTHVALEVLASLSERSTDGRLRDAIATVRSALWDEVEDSELAGQAAVSEDLTHYLFVNMRDVGCNCGERMPEALPTSAEDRHAWFQQHLADVTLPPGEAS